jgi:hypothetical protein
MGCQLIAMYLFAGIYGKHVLGSRSSENSMLNVEPKSFLVRIPSNSDLAA